MANTRLYSQSSVTTAASKYYVLTDASRDYKISDANMLSYIYTGVGGSGSIITKTGYQTMSNKTLTSPTLTTPVITTPTMTNGTYTSGSFTTPVISNPVFNGSDCTVSGYNINLAVNRVVSSAVTAAQLAYLDGLSSNAQTQIDSKLTALNVSNYTMMYGATFRASNTTYTFTTASILAGLTNPITGYTWCIDGNCFQTSLYSYTPGERLKQRVASTQKVYCAANGSGQMITSIDFTSLSSGSYYYGCVAFKIVAAFGGGGT